MLNSKFFFNYHRPRLNNWSWGFTLWSVLQVLTFYHSLFLAQAPNSHGSFDSSYEGNDYVPMVDKVVDASWNKDLLDEKLSIYKGVHDIVYVSKNKDDGKSPMFSGVMALVMGIVGILRLSRHMPKKLMGAELPCNYPVCSADSKVKNGANKLPAISPMEYSSVLKRLGDLEEKLSTFIKKPNEMPFEEEEKLNSAVTRIEMLEAELLATNKALEEVLVRQQELLAHLEKKKKKKKKFNPFRW